MKAQGRKRKLTTSTPVVVTAKPLEVPGAFASSVYDTPGISTRNSRTNRIATSAAVKFPNLRSGISPFEDSGDAVGAQDAIYLCHKAYHNVSIFKQTVDIMSEFSNSPIHWEGSTKAARDFFKAWWKRVGDWHVQDQFYREYYLSGNPVFLRFDGRLSKQEARKLTQVYSEAADAIPVPLEYRLLNPADIRVGGNISFSTGNPTFYKILNPYELARLKSPTTDEEKAFLAALTPDQRAAIKKGESPLISLDPDRIHPIFYKKMDYEPLAVPMGFCVLDDIELKLELKKMDRVILRTVESTILLITMGAEPEKGGINEEAIKAMQQIFANETVGRVLVADYTTKIDFVIPDLNKVLGPTKYQVINNDIANGLSNIFWGEQKFANAMIKIKIFVERLKDGQDVFLQKFLIPEVKRVAKLMGFKTFPTPIFEDIDLYDDIQMAKMITRLAEIGVLTADETIEAIKTGVLPTKEDSEEDQVEFFKLRQQGMYAPLLGPMPLTFKQSQDQKKQEQAHQIAIKQAGRPTGTQAPQSTKNVGPIGTGERKFSLSKLKDVIIASDKLVKSVEDHLKKSHKLKKLSEQQTEAALSISESILANEQPENWEKSIKDYLQPGKDVNHEASAAIEEIAYRHQISPFVATLLYHSTLNA